MPRPVEPSAHRLGAEDADFQRQIAGRHARLAERLGMVEEAQRSLKAKHRLEIDQGLFLSRVLADRRAGAHLIHAMLRPTVDADERLDAFRRTGALDLGGARADWRGKVGYVELTNPRFLNAEDAPETTTEKPWIAAVDAFAIGGGCQLLLVMDHTIAEDGAFFSLPARKEGIVPGAANLRLPRFVGDRLARQAIFFDRRFEAASAEGRLLCDTVVPADEMDATIERAAAALTSAGAVSAASNRKALRAAQEPLDHFQAYMATYAREQAHCHVSPALIRNLEENWRAPERRL